MTEQSDNIVLRRLQELRTEIAQFRTETQVRDEKAQAQIGILSQGQLAIRAEVKSLSDKFTGMANHMHEIAMAIDHHSARLDRIEKRLGLAESTH